MTDSKGELQSTPWKNSWDMGERRPCTLHPHSLRRGRAPGGPTRRTRVPWGEEGGNVEGGAHHGNLRKSFWFHKSLGSISDVPRRQTPSLSHTWLSDADGWPSTSGAAATASRPTPTTWRGTARARPSAIRLRLFVPRRRGDVIPTTAAEEASTFSRRGPDPSGFVSTTPPATRRAPREAWRGAGTGTAATRRRLLSSACIPPSGPSGGSGGSSNGGEMMPHPDQERCAPASLRMIPAGRAKTSQTVSASKSIMCPPGTQPC